MSKLRLNAVLYLYSHVQHRAFGSSCSFVLFLFFVKRVGFLLRLRETGGVLRLDGGDLFEM